MKNYDDIIDLPPFHAKNQPYMKNSDRAAQFMPFKALTGYEQSIGEQTRLSNADDGWDYIDYDEILKNDQL